MEVEVEVEVEMEVEVEVVNREGFMLCHGDRTTPDQVEYYKHVLT